MSKFSEHERDRIEETLLEGGREQFARFGHDRTRIKDLTDEAGIAPSTFYQFFDSKEELYLEVLRSERDRVSTEIEAALEAAPDLESEVRVGLEQFFEELEANPLYYRLIVEDELESLHHRLADSSLEAFYREQLAVYEPYARRWTSKEAFRIDDPAVVVELFRLLAFTIVAKEHFGEITDQKLAAAHETLLDVIVDGLLTPE